MRKLTILLGMLISVVLPSVFAGEGVYLGPSLGYHYLDSKRVVDGHDDAGVLGLNLGYEFFNNWALEMGFGSDVAGDDLDVAQLNYYWWFTGKDSGWSPYLVAGLSYYDRNNVANLQPEEEYTHQGHIGFGLTKMLNDRWEFRSDVRYAHKLREGQDGTNDGILNLALNYHFSAPEAVPVEVRVAPVPEPEYEPAIRTITVRLNVEFEFDKAVVLAVYGDELQAVANAMKAHRDIVLLLEGHTDSKGSDAYNNDLSERRAAAVKNKLVEDSGISADRISTVGYGESRPIADNETEEGRAHNRRVIGELSYTEVEAEY